MSAPSRNDQDSEAEPSEAGPAASASRCHNCGGELGLLVHVEPQTNSQPVNYYACERCAHVVVSKS